MFTRPLTQTPCPHPILQSPPIQEDPALPPLTPREEAAAQPPSLLPRCPPRTHRAASTQTQGRRGGSRLSASAANSWPEGRGTAQLLALEAPVKQAILHSTRGSHPKRLTPLPEPCPHAGMCPAWGLHRLSALTGPGGGGRAHGSCPAQVGPLLPQGHSPFPRPPCCGPAAERWPREHVAPLRARSPRLLRPTVLLHAPRHLLALPLMRKGQLGEELPQPITDPCGSEDTEKRKHNSSRINLESAEPRRVTANRPVNAGVGGCPQPPGPGGAQPRGGGGTALVCSDGGTQSTGRSTDGQGRKRPHCC